MTLDPDLSDDELGLSAPRAPSQAAWDATSPADRQRALDALPDDIPWEEIGMPEGDPHYDAKNDARDVLRGFFQHLRRSVYVAADLAVYYPDERRFSPDVLAVLDVAPHSHMKWVTNAEGKGLDFVLEVLVAGRRRKDNETNVARYARLGIPEYFVYDHRRATVRGWRLPAQGPRVYEPIVSRGGRVHAETLGLDLGVLEHRLRFFYANAVLRPSSEVLDALEVHIEDLSGAVENERARADDERTRADKAEAEVARLREELDRLRRG